MVKVVDYKQLFNHNSSYRNLLNIAPIGISIIDSDLNIVMANNTFPRVIGITRKDIINQHHKKLRYIDQNGAEKSLDELSDSLIAYNGRIIKDIVIGIIHEDKKIKWVEVTAAPVDKSGKYSVIIVHDITERKLLNNKLTESNLKLMSLYENSLDAIFLTVTDGTIMAANPAACRMLQMTEKEICLKGRNGVVDLNDPRLAAALKERAEKGKFCGELNMIRKNGEIFPVEVSTSSFFSDDGMNLTSMIIRDISNRKKYETEYNEMTEKLRGLSWHLQQAIESERRKIAMELHDDLGQKLSALKLFCSSLQPVMKKDYSEYLDGFNEALRLIDETVESLNRISYGLRPSLLEDLGIIAVIEWHVNEFSIATGILCRTKYDPEAITLNSSISLVIFRIIQESLTNIFKHSKATRVSIRMTLDSISLILVVKDNGIGIDIENIHNPKSFGISGMKERVKSIGGELIINGVKNKGTQILVSIPVNKIE